MCQDSDLFGSIWEQRRTQFAVNDFFCDQFTFVWFIIVQYLTHILHFQRKFIDFLHCVWFLLSLFKIYIKKTQTLELKSEVYQIWNILIYKDDITNI